jgi:hypothetical protein
MNGFSAFQKNGGFIRSRLASHSNSTLPRTAVSWLRESTSPLVRARSGLCVANAPHASHLQNAPHHFRIERRMCGAWS